MRTSDEHSLSRGLLGRGYRGTAADVRLYNRTLSSDEIRTLAE